MPRPLQSALTRFVTQNGTQKALTNTRSTIAQLNSQLSTGMRIQTPSDDPSGFDQAKGLQRLQDRIAQYHRNLDSATLWNDRTQQELDSLSDLFVEAKEIGLRGANGVLDREDLALQVDRLRDETISRLNAQSGGEYLFAGNATTTQPINADGTVAAGDFSGARQREVAPGVTATLNVTGALTLDGVSAPDRLQALSDALRAGDNDAITTALEGVETGVDHYIRLASGTGNTARTLESSRATLNQQDLVLGEQRAAIEEIDLVETMGALQRQQVGLEAALRATASSVQLSLMNYLP